MIRLICVDADDTLWHNMRHFDETQQALVELLAPFGGDPTITRERLEQCEVRNLKLYGYGAKGFTLSMIETALELVGDELPASAIRDILAAGRRLLAHPVQLFDGIEETLEALSDRGRLVLVTKGDLFHQESKLAASGLGDRFSGIEIVSDKTSETFTRLFGRYDTPPDQAIMAGDSMRSDIIPALEAGAWAAFIPQPLAWGHEKAPAPAGQRRFRQINRLADLPLWIDEINGEARLPDGSAA